MGNNYDQEDLAEDDSNSGQANDRPSYQVVQQDPNSIRFCFVSLAHNLSKGTALRSGANHQSAVHEKKKVNFILKPF